MLMTALFVVWRFFEMESELQKGSAWEGVCTRGDSILENLPAKELGGMLSRESPLQGERE